MIPSWIYNLMVEERNRTSGIIRLPKENKVYAEPAVLAFPRIRRF